MITGILLTKDEEQNISDSIKSLSFCKRIIVIDDNSSDNTREIAIKLKADVFVHSLNNDFSAQSNFGVSKVDSGWIFFLDADERVTDNLAKEIVSLTNESKHNAYQFKRIDYMWGRWLKYGETKNFKSIRLFKKGSGKWVRRVHQYYETDESVGSVKNPIHHYPHKNLHVFIDKVNRWSSMHAVANNEEGKKSSLLIICSYPVMHFIKNYIFNFGFLDGMRGFVFALVMASHSFLAWSKLWMLQKGFKRI